MKIKRLSFRNVGPFGSKGISLDGFSSGLNVVCETNEFGKSSILKALEMILFKPFSTTHKDVKALLTAGSEGGIEGEVNFSNEGREYLFSKRFLKQKGARLQDNDTGEVLAVDRSAEEALAKLLRADRFDGGPSGLLWVRQGTSMEGIGDDGQIASLLEGELGTLIGGDRARSYLTRVEAELAEVVTSTGLEKKNGALRRAREAAEGTESELAEAQRLRDQTTSIGVELMTVNAEILRLENQAQDTKGAKEIEATRAAMTAAQSFSNALALVTAQQEQAALTAERAAERQTDHVAALLTFNETQKNLESQAAAQVSKTAELQAIEKAYAERRQAVADLESELEAFSEVQLRRETQVRQKQRLEILQKDRQALAAQLDHLAQLEDKLTQLTATISDLPVITRADVESLRQADHALRQSNAALTALSTRLYLDLAPKGEGKVTLSGQTLPSGPVELTASAALVFEGIGELRSDESSAREIAQNRDQAQAEFDARLARFSVSDIAEASKIAEQRQDIEQSRKHITADKARLAPEGRAAIETALSAAETEAQSLSDSLDDDVAENPETENSDILERLRAERAQLKVTEESLAKAHQNITLSETQQARLQERLSGLNLPQKQNERNAQADGLAREKLKADSDLRVAIAEVAALKSKAPAQSYDMLKVRLARLEQVATQSREGLEALKTKAAVLQARRDAAFEEGDAQSVVAALQDRLTKEQEELTRQLRAKDVRILLRDTLTATQTRLKEAYTAPVKKELAPLLSRVIPGAEAGLDDRLSVDRVQRNGKTEAIAQVSGGTQEQFAILTRLAYARLLARSGSRVPVILDDALVYADDARRDAMFDVLGLVSSGETPIQIVYLSCHAGATAQLGGTRITPQPWTA